jgi:PST family polysaccharide transporter
VPLLLVPYLVTTVGIKNFGISSVAFSVSFFYSMIVDYGFYITGVNKLSKEKNPKNISSIITNIIYTKALIFLALLPIFLVIYYYLATNTLEWYVYLFSLFIPFASILNLSWALQGLHKIKAWSLLTILGQVFYIIMIFLCIHKPDDVTIVNLFYGLGLLLSGLASLWYLTKNFFLEFKRINSISIVEELKGGYHFFLSNIGNYTALYFLSPLIGFLISYEMAGIYAIIEKIYNIARRPFAIYQTFMLPKVSQQIQISKELAKKTIKDTYKFVILFMLVEAVLVFIFKTQIITYFTDINLSLLENMLMISLIGILLVLINCPLFLYLIAMDKKQVLMRISLIAPIFGIIAGFILISAFGIIGSIVTMLCIELFYTITLWLVYRGTALDEIAVKS